MRNLTKKKKNSLQITEGKLYIIMSVKMANIQFDKFRIKMRRHTEKAN